MIGCERADHRQEQPSADGIGGRIRPLTRRSDAADPARRQIERDASARCWRRIGLKNADDHDGRTILLGNKPAGLHQFASLVASHRLESRLQRRPPGLLPLADRE